MSRSDLHGAVAKLRFGSPLETDAAWEIERLLHLLRAEGWSGSITADQALAVLIRASEDKDVKILELERRVATLEDLLVQVYDSGGKVPVKLRKLIERKLARRLRERNRHANGRVI